MPTLPRRMRDAPGCRFLLAGGLAAAFNWTVRFPISAVLPFAEAIVAAQVASWVIGFTLYRALVFAPSRRALWQQMLCFVAVNTTSLVGVLAVTLALARMLRSVAVEAALAEAAAHGAGIAAGAVISFFGHRALTFSAAPIRLR